jgi:ubiquinone/menaquinone biosynthesis C-methylase UbiE
MTNKFWSKRAEHYKELKWITDKGLLLSILNMCEPKKKDVVLDLGTGSGVIAQTLQPYVTQIIGMDVSNEMMNKGHWENMSKIKGNILSPIFRNNVFDIIVARMVFHHVNPILKGLKNCYNLLKKNGKLIIAESIPPSDESNVVNWWGEVRSLKEKRIVFTPKILKEYLNYIGFKNIEYNIYTQSKETSSTKNWLTSSGLSTKIQQQIYEFHENAPNEIKIAHKMEITNNDIFCQHRHIIIKGIK